VIHYREIPGTDLVEIEVDGAIERADFERVAARLEAAIARHGKLRLLEVVRSFTGIDAQTLWQDMKFSLRHLNAFSRVAVATDFKWIRPLATVAGSLIAGEVRVFALGEVGAARAWLNQDAASAAR
jgi:SpoIIAA-like